MPQLTRQRKSNLKKYDQAFAALSVENQRDILSLLSKFLFGENAKRRSKIRAHSREQLHK